MRKCANICEFLDMRHNFRICDFKNAIRADMQKIWDMRILTKYDAIAYSHITSIPK